MTMWVNVNSSESFKDIKGLKARNCFEEKTFKVEWNSEYGCFGLYNKPHVLVRVDEVWVNRYVDC